MLLSDFKFSLLQSNDLIFDCGDSDLNDFFRTDAIPNQKALLTKTYYWHKDNIVIGFVSLLNDSIQLKHSKKKKLFHKSKFYRSYPAVKIGRLGINKDFQRKGLGNSIIRFIKMFMVCRNKTGCRFITIDAYNHSNVTNFYGKNNFIFFTKSDERDETRAMYYDLNPDSNELQKNKDVQNTISKYISTMNY